MPRPAPDTSALRVPLDRLLGTRGGVSVLRALSLTSIPLSQAELARRAGLHLRGLPAVLDGLEAGGMVSYVGRGRTRQLQLHQAHPLAHSLRQLFLAESMRWESVVQALRGAMRSQASNITSAWIEGAVATGNDTFASTITVATVSERLMTVAAREQLRQQLNAMQSAQHVVISTHHYQLADLARLTSARRAELGRAILLFGPAPLDLPQAALPMTKKDAAEGRASRAAGAAPADRPRRIADLIAAKLRRDPELLVRARDFIDRRLPIAGETERLALHEWKGLLDSLTAGQVAMVLREDSQRADQLRQSLPFVGILTEAERAGLFAHAKPSLPKNVKVVKRVKRA